MSRKAFAAEGAVSVGPYSHAVETDGFVYLSGQTPMDSTTGKIITGDITAQTKQSFINLFNVLKAADLTSDDVIKVTVFLTDMNNFSLVRRICGYIPAMEDSQAYDIKHILMFHIDENHMIF